MANKTHQSSFFIEASTQEINALLFILDEFSAGLGAAEDDSKRIKALKKVDKLLQESGITRNIK